MFTLTKINVMWEKLLALTKKVDAIDVEIPPHAAGDAGKYLGVDNSGNLEFSDPLPATSGASAGDVLGLVGENKAKGWITPYTPLDYSTTEQNTGYKWTDGKDIYVKVVTIPLTTSRNSSGDLSIDNLIEIRGFISQTSEFYKTTILPLYFGSSYYATVSGGVDNDIIIQQAGYNGETATVIAFYTKVTSDPETKSTKKKTTKNKED